MEKQTVIDFFDSLAKDWDRDMVKSDEIIGRILKNAGFERSQEVLDVACGTGVMFDYYLSGGAKRIVGIDISPKMCEIARDKYKNIPEVSVLLGDVTEYPLEDKFDLIVVYNAFPHFPEPERLIRVLSSLLKENGRLTVAHGESREKIDARHHGAASTVSVGLMPSEELAALFEPYFEVETVISDDTMYQVVGKQRR